MKIKWVHWIYHGKSEINRYTINSIDINPFRSLIVTSGKDALIKIWNITSLQNNSAKNNLIVKKQIRHDNTENFCTVFKIYERPVNIVRWSINGKLLASGGGDGRLVLHRESYFKGNKKKFFKIFFIFKPIQHDIISINWSPDSNFISITSQTNTIVIYAIKKKQVFAKITSRVFSLKGSCWDPFGYFLATQSNSQGIKIWNTSRWKLCKTVEFVTNSKIILKYSQKSTLGKPSWTSCGKYILFYDNFTIDQNHFLRAIERAGNFIKYKIFFQGENYINNIRGSPRIYIGKPRPKISSVVAVSTEDGKLYLWALNFSKITILIKNLSGKTFTDISWGFDGYELYITTLEGNVFSIHFNSDELGKVLNFKDHIEFLTIFSKKNWNNLKDSFFSSSFKNEMVNTSNLKYLSFFPPLLFKRNILKSTILHKKLFLFRIYFNQTFFKKRLWDIIPQTSYTKIKCHFPFIFKIYFGIWIKLNYKNYFLHSHYLSIEIEILISNFSINYFENKVFIVINFPNKKNFKLASISKINSKILSINYRHQINKLKLKKNIIIIYTTRGRVDILKSDNLHQLFFLDCLKFENSFLGYQYSTFFKKIFKCSGLIVYCQKLPVLFSTN